MRKPIKEFLNENNLDFFNNPKNDCMIVFGAKFTNQGPGSLGKINL